VGAIKDNLSTIVFKSPTGYHFDYYIPGYGFGTKQPISAIRATGSYLYTQNGVTVDKRDLYTGAIITSVSIPSGISNAGFFGTNVQGNGGLDIDSCGNVYVGSGNGVYKFDSNLFPIGSAPTPGPVYDVDVSSNGDVAVAGSNFTGTVSLNSCNRLASGCYSTLTASASCTNNACYGQCNATASVSAQGGTPPYSYAWSNGATTPLLTGLCSGSYTAIVSDAASLLDTVTITVNGATAPLITSVNATSASCGASNGSASVVATGGVLPFTFSWSPVGGNSPIASGLSSGTYAITVTDGLGCSVTDTVIVGSSNAPSLSLLNSSNVLCFGGMNGSAEVAASLGVSPYTYSWNTIPVQSSSIATGLSAGSYTATVTDAAGCTQQQAVVILQPATLTTTTASTPEQCGIATGTVSVTASGGTGPYTYHWLPEGGTNPTVAGLIGGTYYVSVTDSNGCTTTDSVTVASNPGVQVALINSSNVRCHGADDGSISVNALTGTPPFIYAWNTTPIQNSATAVALSPNNYTVTVTDATGCTAQLTVGITEPAPLILAGSSTPEHCGLSDGSIAISTVGGVLPLVYSWTPAVATDSLATNLPAGSYTVTVSDSNGCTVSASYSIINQTTFPVSIASASGCGASGASAIASVSGGSAPYTYSWIPGGATTASINGLADGLYACIVTDAGGCSVTQTVQVHNYPGAVAQAGSDVVIEAGTTTSLQATGGMTYLWTPPEGLSCTTCSNPVAGPLVSTQYCVTVTDTNGCTDSDCLMLTVNTECGHVFVPNAFSPDGADNVQNEMECVYGRCIDRLEFVIYSRWGEKVFEAYDKNTCWDGTYKGEKLNAAVFTYTLNATLTDGSVITQKGDISLIR
jgi:gliding motility-associated-like protein